MAKKVAIKKVTEDAPKMQAEPRVIGGSDRDFWGDIDSEVDDEWARKVNKALAEADTE